MARLRGRDTIYPEQHNIIFGLLYGGAVPAWKTH
jgi:hypothetical protein